jgi:hypothetical protein
VARLKDLIDQILESSRKERAASLGVSPAEVSAIEEKEARERDDKEPSMREQTAKKMALDEKRTVGERAEMGRRLGLSVPTSVGYAVRVRMLTGKNWGDGVSKATVLHLRVHADFAFGKLSRANGEFLCSARVGKFDKESVSDGDESKVTCPKCLELIKRIQRARIGPTE